MSSIYNKQFVIVVFGLCRILSFLYDLQRGFSFYCNVKYLVGGGIRTASLFDRRRRRCRRRRR